nr:MAG: hypothetical protein [Microviridae sp.]
MKKKHAKKTSYGAKHTKSKKIHKRVGKGTRSGGTYTIPRGGIRM